MDAFETPEDGCLLFLVRHGATANNLAHPPKLQGQRENPPLSPTGRAQADAVARYLGHFPLAAVYSSPLVRARETAEEIARPHQLQVEILPALIECDIGRWEGLSWDQVRKDDAEAHRLFHEDAGQHPYAGGENLTQVNDRAAPVILEICRRHIGRPVAIAAHNVVNRAFLAHLLELPLKHARRIPQENCGVNVLRWRDGKLNVLTINSVEHLGRRR